MSVSVSVSVRVSVRVSVSVRAERHDAACQVDDATPCKVEHPAQHRVGVGDSQPTLGAPDPPMCVTCARAHTYTDEM